MIKIDLNDYVQTGEGANAASYDCKADSSVMVKLYNTSYDTSTIYKELEAARKVYDLGIPSPQPGEIVTDGSRTGIRFRRIAHKRSFARAMADEPERTEELSREFALCCKRFHSVQCPEDKVVDTKEDYLKLLAAEKELSDGEKEIMKTFLLERIPDCNTALHGDMHFGNVITTLPKGAPLDTPHEVFFIDLGYFARGFQLFDLGMTWNICNLADADFVQHDFHFGQDVAHRAWAAFEDEYFFAEDALAEKFFGKGATHGDVRRGLAPYVSLKLLLVEYNLGFMPPQYLTFVKDTIKLMK